MRKGFAVTCLLLILLLPLMLCFQSCSSTPSNTPVNPTYNPNRDKILLTSELKKEMEDYLTEKMSSSETKWAEFHLGMECTDRIKNNDDIKDIDCEIISHRQKDDYTYIAYVVCKVHDYYGYYRELKTNFEFTFKEFSDTKERYISTDYAQFEHDIRNFNTK